MEFSPLNCPICYERFDQTQRNPRMIPTCGHTLCSSCLANVLKNFLASCPLDKKSFGNLKIENFPVNYALTQLLSEDRISAGICPDHKKEVRFACCTEKLKLCYDCISKDNHPIDHKIVSLDDLRFQVIPQRNELKELLEYVENCYEEANKGLEEERHYCLKRVKHKMEQFRNALYQKELELIFEINNHYDEQITKLNEAINETKVLRNEINTKVLNLVNFSQESDIFMTEDYFDDLMKHIQECKSTLNSEKLQEELQSIKAALHEKSEKLEASIFDQTELLNEIKFPVKGSCNDFLKVVVPHKEEAEISEPEDKLCILSCLEITKSWESLEIIAQDKNPCEIFFEPSVYDVIEAVTIHINQRAISQNDLEILNCMIQKCQNMTSLKLKFASGSFSHNLYQVLAQNLNKCATIEINIDGYQEQSPLVLSLIKMMLRMGNFENVVLTMKNTKLIWDNSIKEMFEDSNITSLTLNVERANLPDQEVCCLSLPLVLQNLNLCLYYTELKKETFKTIFNRAICPLEELTNLTLGLHGTKITDEEIESLSVINLKFLKILCLAIGGTEITGRGINSLSKLLNQFSDHLESLTLGLGGCKITDKDLVQLNLRMPKLTYLYFHLNTVPITDGSIESLFDNMISLAIELKQLRLFITYTNISDNSIRKIFQNVERITYLDIDFSHTAVSDQSIKPLVREILPKLKNLKSLEINISETRASKAISEELEEYKKKLSSS